MGVGFYVERRNNNKLKEQADIHAKEVKELHKKIDEKTEMLNTTIHEMETRLCNTMVEKDGINEKDAASKILNAKNIVDEKFRNIDGRLQNIEKYFWSNKFGQPGTYTDSTKKKMGNSNNRNYDHYDDNDDDNGGSCLSG